LPRKKEADMNRGIALIVLLSVLLVFSGCAFVSIKTPFDTDLDNTELGTKKGTAQAYSLLWLVSWGDASYAAAAKNGDIKVMKHADQEMLQILLGLYTRWRIVVYGD